MFPSSITAMTTVKTVQSLTSLSSIYSCHCLNVLTCPLCWSDHRSQRCRRSSAWGGRYSLAGRMFAAAGTRHSDNGSPLRSRTWCWRACSLTSICRYQSPLWMVGSGESWITRAPGSNSSALRFLLQEHKCMSGKTTQRCYFVVVYQENKSSKAWKMFSLTYTENVKTKSLCDRFTDQLVREAVESNMSAQTQVTLLFILRDTNKNKTNQTLDVWLQCEEKTHGEDISQSCLLKPSNADANEHPRPSVRSADVKPRRVSEVIRARSEDSRIILHKHEELNTFPHRENILFYKKQPEKLPHLGIKYGAWKTSWQ